MSRSLSDGRKGGVSSFTDQRSGKRRWMIKWPIVNADGSKGYRYIRRFDLKRDAEAEFDRMRKVEEKGQDVFASDILFGAYAQDFVEAAVREGKWRASTALRNQGLLSNFILPVLDRVEVAAIKPGHVRAILSDMRERGLSKSSISQARACMSAILKRAVQDELLVTNHARVVDTPKSKKPVVTKVIPTDQQVVALLEVSKGTEWELPLLLAATTGCRRSEVIGLTWSAVNLDVGVIEIRQGLHYDHVKGEDGVRKRVLVPLDPKSRESRRSVTLAPFVVERLRRHRADQLQRKVSAGPAWAAVDEEGQPLYVLDRGDGHPIDPERFSDAFMSLGREAGLDSRTTLHGLRHAYLTGLADDGFNAKVIASIAGHHDPAFTFKQYIEPRQAVLNAAAAATEARYGTS